MRAKIINGVFTPAPRRINREIDGVEYVTYNPTDEMLADAGWLIVVETEPPEAPEGYHYEPTYTEDGGEIVQDWELVETEYSDAEVAEILFGGDEP